MYNIMYMLNATMKMEAFFPYSSDMKGTSQQTFYGMYHKWFDVMIYNCVVIRGYPLTNTAGSLIHQCLYNSQQFTLNASKANILCSCISFDLLVLY